LGANLTDSSVTAGSTAGLTFSYFLDANQMNYASTPKNITTSGTYYIKAANAAGCTDIQPVNVIINPSPNLVVNNPNPVCVPDKVDLTSSSITAGSEPGLTLSYWKDAAATISLSSPDAVDVTGTYYIKAQNNFGCTTLLPINVFVGVLPHLSINNPIGCGQVDITKPNVLLANTNDFTYTFWQDAATANSLQNPNAIATSGTYYVKATAVNGCTIIQPINTVVNPNPVLNITNPAPVRFPVTIDLTTLVPASGDIYSYWKDSLTNKILSNPTMVDTTGTYFIKALNSFGCTTVAPVKVEIDEPILAVPNTFSPNGDGYNDTWEIPLLNRRYPQCVVEVYDRDGRLIFRSVGYATPWNGSIHNKPLPVSTYYYIIKRAPEYAPITGSITILK
jgi:gliding motility-associated-like protein